VNGKRYFIVESGTVAEALDKFISARKEAIAKRNVFLERYGATQLYWNRNGIASIVLETPPEGWVRSRHGGWKPDHRTKEGRALIKEMKAIRDLDYRDLQAAVIGNDSPFIFMEGMRCLFMGLESVNGTRILVVPDISETGGGIVRGEGWIAPEGCREIKTSEFYALKEAAAEQKGGEA